MMELTLTNPFLGGYSGCSVLKNMIDISPFLGKSFLQLLFYRKSRFETANPGSKKK